MVNILRYKNDIKFNVCVNSNQVSEISKVGTSLSQIDPSAATDSPKLFVLAAEGVELLLLPGVALDPGEELLCGEADLWESLLATLASSG